VQEGELLSLKGVFKRDDFELDNLFVVQIRLPQDVKVTWWQWGLFAFVLYYLPPAIVALFQGSLWPPEGYPKFIHGAHPRTYYYGTDAVHGLIAVVGALVGGSLFAAALERFACVAHALIERDLLTATEDEIRNALTHTRRAYRHPIVQVAIFALSIFGAGSVLVVTGTDGDWWGNAGRGWSGFAFVVVSWLMLYFGSVSIIGLAFAIWGFATLFRHPVRLRPLHSDECNGFGIFGEYLVLLFSCAIAIAATVWVAVGSEYLHLDRLPGVWVTSAIVILAIPVFFIFPLLTCTTQIRAARAARVGPLESALEVALGAFETEAAKNGPELAPLSDGLERFAKAREAIARVFPTNPFPFRPKLIGTLRAPNKTWPTCRWMDRWTVPWQSRLYRTRCGNESNLCFQPNAPSRRGVDRRSPTARSSRGSSSCCGRAFRGSTCRRRWAAEAA
jgi:hypothetical protein